MTRPRDIPRAEVHPDGCVTLHDGWSDAPLHLPTTAMAREACARWLAGMDAHEGIEHAAPTTCWVEINASQLRPSTAERNGDTLTDGRRILTLRMGLGGQLSGKWIVDATDARGLYTFGRKDRVTVLTPRPETDLAEFGKRAVDHIATAIADAGPHTAEMHEPKVVA